MAANVTTQVPTPLDLAGSLQQPLAGRSLPDENSLVRSIYSTTGRLLWSTGDGFTPQARELLALVHSADVLGLRALDYGDAQFDAVRGASAQPTKQAGYAQLDVWLTEAAARLISHLHYGRIDPRTVGFELPDSRHDLDVPTAVMGLATSVSVADSVSQAEPHFYHYALLKRALARYRELAADPSLTSLVATGTKTLHRGEPYAGAQGLRRLLAAEGDLAAAVDVASDDSIDAGMSDALKRYQSRHGLAITGNLDGATWVALTTPLAARVRQIELTLERWRWIPAFSSPPIIVNIPEFELFAFNTMTDRAASLLQIPVIVGQAYASKRTPVFLGELKRVVFRPYWDIPRSITLHEVLPGLRRHPDYLQRNHMELVRGEGDDGAIIAPSDEAVAQLAAGRLRARQKPGEDNALGLIKFLFPNAHNVYMHSTPAHQLFLASRRTFSHGCIRVADPVALAAYVLKNAPGSWDTSRIEAAMHGTTTFHVDLIEPIQVMILYGTVMATEAGPVQFFDDIYGHDRQLAALLGI
ncbi:MAG: L,D-transpeptidase family protein [Steroidobacteraceae bacterium]